MPRTRPPYPDEFRQRMVELVRAGRTPESLGKGFEPSGQTIRNWVRQADLDEGRRADGLTIAERAELRRLRRENAQLREPAPPPWCPRTKKRIRDMPRYTGIYRDMPGYSGMRPRRLRQ